MKNEYLIPPELRNVIGAVELDRTAANVDNVLGEIAAARSAKEHAFEGKGPLVKRRRELETQLMLHEANIFSTHITSDGKNGVLPEDGGLFPLNNDSNRAIFKKIHSAPILAEIGKIEADLVQLEVDIIQAELDLQAATKKADTIAAFAFVQGRVLQYLAAGSGE